MERAPSIALQLRLVLVTRKHRGSSTAKRAAQRVSVAEAAAKHRHTRPATLMTECRHSAARCQCGVVVEAAAARDVVVEAAAACGVVVEAAATRKRAGEARQLCVCC